MKAVKVLLKDAQKVKRQLLAADLLDHSRKPKKDDTHIFFPVLKEVEGLQTIEAALEEAENKQDLKEALQGVLSQEELDQLKTAFDTVGTIAILEIDEPLWPKEKLIAETLLKVNPAIKTVLRKEDKHDGTFRTQKLKFLAGKKTKETEHKENGVRLMLDVEQVYFSPRLATERKRVMQLVKPGEDVLVMFSGCGPYTCTIAKNTKAKSVTGIEINPKGHEYAEKNITLNKLTNVTNHCGDVREVIQKLTKKFDRIFMPLPMSAEDFLDVALSAAKPKATIHFYDFLNEEDIPDAAVKKIKAVCPNAELLGHVKCGQFSPKTFRVCVDFRT